jgi:hypothetical protein
MLHKCANPPCSRLFRKMSEGKLFQLSRHSAHSQRGATGWEYFWLCDQCALLFTLTVSAESAVNIVPLPHGFNRSRLGTAADRTFDSNLGEIRCNS